MLHWKINSAATAKLITTTLSAMAADAKTGPAEALRRAISVLIGERQRR